MPELPPSPSRRFPAALLCAYAAGLGLGLGSIPLAAWVCDSSRDPMGTGYVFFCCAGAAAGGLAWTVLSIVSIVRRERARFLAVLNLAAVAAVLAAAAVTGLLSWARR